MNFNRKIYLRRISYPVITSREGVVPPSRTLLFRRKAFSSRRSLGAIDYCVILSERKRVEESFLLDIKEEK